MKRLLALLSVLSGALLVTAVPVQAAATATVIHERDSQNAFAVYTSVNGNVEADAFVVAGSGKMQMPPGAPQLQQAAYLEIAIVDISAPGKPVPISIGQGQAMPTTLTFGTNLSAATVVATIPMLDYFTGGPMGNAEVNLSWTGVGAVTSQNTISHMRTAGFSVTNHFMGTSRAADVSGSILFGDVNFATGLLNQAGLQSVKISEIDIQH